MNTERKKKIQKVCAFSCPTLSAEYF